MEQNQYVSYIRVSTKGQNISGLGQEGQRDEAKKFAYRTGGIIIAEYNEVETGKKNARPELHKAIAHCNREGATLLIAKLDRLARNAFFILGLQEAGVKFIACDMPEATHFVVGIMGLVAQNEAKAISDRTKAALKAKRARVAAGIDPPYKQGREKGFKHSAETKRKISNSRRKVNVNAPILRNLAIERRAAGLAYQKIADELTALGFTAPMGGKLHPGHIARIIKQKTPTH